MTTGAEIVAWLNGLEQMRENVVSVSSDAREVATMIARRGVYEGVADDIKRKWPALFDSSSPMPGPVGDDDRCDWCDRPAEFYNAGTRYCDRAECAVSFRKDSPKKAGHSSPPEGRFGLGDPVAMDAAFLALRRHANDQCDCGLKIDCLREVARLSSPFTRFEHPEKKT